MPLRFETGYDCAEDGCWALRPESKTREAAFEDCRECTRCYCLRDGFKSYLTGVVVSR